VSSTFASALVEDYARAVVAVERYELMQPLLSPMELLLLVPLIAVNPKRLTRQSEVFRVLSLTLVLVIAASNLVALGILIHELVYAGVKDGRSLLVAALQVWLTNIIVFGLAYWEPDRGGPVTRTQARRPDLPLADFRFPQDEDDDAVQEVADGASATSDWMPILTAAPAKTEGRAAWD
jgi:hypothetical protein